MYLPHQNRRGHSSALAQFFTPYLSLQFYYARVKSKPAEIRSPLPYKPLRLPGESVDKQIQKVIEDKIDANLVGFVGSFVLMFYAWITYFLKTPPLIAAVTASVVAVGAAVYTVFKIKAARAELKQLRQGRDGERIVAEQLDVLKEQGFHVIHDLTGDGFNIDHVVVSPKGIFTVETKTYSKPKKGNAKIIYNGETITVGSFTPERDPIAQAKHQAGWLKRHLKESTGQDFPVRPVVVYPGWYVQQTVKHPKVWVLEPKALPSFIKHEPVILDKADVYLASSRLKSYLRTFS